MFTKGFGRFVCPGDTIRCTVDGFDVCATVHYDEDTTPPDERQDGFWPTRDPKSAGYVTDDNFDSELTKAQRVMVAWRNDEWHYCGVAVTVSKGGVDLLGRYDVALWGVEMNYPDTDNEYLLTVANDLIDDAMAQARAKLATLCEESCGGIREVNEDAMVEAHKSGIAYWNRNKPRDATKDGLESLARTLGWYGVLCDSFVAGVIGAKRREAESVR